MGDIWLHDWPRFLEKWEVEFDLYPGCELRSRRSGGFEQVLGVGTHHGAAHMKTPIENELGWMYTNSPDRPIGNGLLHRGTGKFTIGAMGATNTQGRGGPLSATLGDIPLNQGNMYMVSIEAQNNGIGEPWSRDMMRAYFRVCMSICEMFGLDPNVDIWSHKDYCKPSVPGRKVDPVGPTPDFPAIGGISDANPWRDRKFNAQVNLLTFSTPDPTPEPNPRKRKFKMFDAIIVPAKEWLGANKTPHLTMAGNTYGRAVNSHYAIAKQQNLPVVIEESEEHYRHLHSLMVARETSVLSN